MTSAPRSLRRGWVVALLVAAAVVLGAEVGARWLSPAFPEGGLGELEAKQARLADFADGSPPDVIAVGSSAFDSAVRAEPFVEASEEHDSLYNASLLGLGPAPAAAWIRRDVDEVDADLLLLEVGVLAVGTQEGGPATELATDIIDTPESGWSGALRDAGDASDLVDLRGALRSPTLTGEAVRDRLAGDETLDIPDRAPGFWDDVLAEDGAVLDYEGSVFDADRLAATLRSNAEQINSSRGFRLADVDRLMATASESGLDTVVVIPPLLYDEHVAAGADPDRIEALTELIVRRAERNDLPVVDFSRVGYPPTYFADVFHLNETGAEAFSRNLAATLNGR